MGHKCPTLMSQQSDSKSGSKLLLAATTTTPCTSQSYKMLFAFLIFILDTCNYNSKDWKMLHPFLFIALKHDS